MNIAARLCSLAKPGEIIISESTLQLAGPHILVEPRKAVQVKGKREALPIYAVQGIRDSAPPSNRSGSGLLASDPADALAGAEPTAALSRHAAPTVVRRL